MTRLQQLLKLTLGWPRPNTEPTPPNTEPRLPNAERLL
jgi:hypothetical protein